MLSVGSNKWKVQFRIEKSKLVFFLISWNSDAHHRFESISRLETFLQSTKEVFQFIGIMKALMTIRQMLIWISICQPIEFTSNWKKRAFFVFYLISVSTNSFSVIITFIFLSKFTSIDLITCLGMIYVVAGSSAIISSLILAFFLRHKIDDIFNKLSNIYETSKYFVINCGDFNFL